VVGNL
jgi:hypothetical protein